MEHLNFLETERLALRPVSEADAEHIFRLYNEPKFIEFIGDKNIHSVEDARKYINERFLPQVQKLGFGNNVIIRKEDQQKLGSMGIFEREGLDVYDIGFSLLPEFENHGYAFEAASALLDVALTKLGLEKISAITTHTNFPSQKLIEKLGLKYIKTVVLPNDTEELRYYETGNMTIKKETP